MPIGIPEKMKQVIDRTTGGERLTVYRSGPFFEVYINDVLVGKVKGASKLHCVPAEHVADECLRLKNHVIALTDEEMMDIAYENNLAAELRAGTN